jgi:hypothetical protein
MAHPGASLGQNTDQLTREIREFFEFRPGQPLYFAGTPTHKYLSSEGKTNKTYTSWDWLSLYPQRIAGYSHTSKPTGETGGVTLNLGTSETREQMAVGVAQNWSYNNSTTAKFVSAEITAPGGARPQGTITAMNGNNVIGRSSYRTMDDFTQNASQNPDLYAIDPRGIAYGANFAQQFDYAIKMDPEFIFITGWNEWIAGRYDWWPPHSPAPMDPYMGVINAFPDTYNERFSRDIEPTKNSTLKDHYYYQMVSYIRLYKGVNEIPASTKKYSIDIDGSATQWNGVEPVYRSYQNNINDRDADGYAGYHHENRTGRNDITETRAAHDDDNVYFMVKTKNALSPYTDPEWMRLLINVDGRSGNNWEGYHYILNKKNPTSSAAALEAANAPGAWSWSMAGEVSYKAEGNMLIVAIPKAMLGISGDVFTLNFKWTDNTLSDAGGNDILDFYQYGDTAPGGRFNYCYKARLEGTD